MQQFRLIDAFNAGFHHVRANPRIVLPYLALAVLGPLTVFSLFQQSSTRHFMVVFGDPYALISAETPRTIASMFLIALFLIWSALFAAWNALLSRSRDGFAGELMYGAVAALLSGLVVAGIYIAYSLVTFAITLIGMGVSLSSFGDPASPVPNPPIWLSVLILLAWLPMLWLTARLCLSGPAMAESGSINPIAGLRQSWKLTAPAQWRILAYLFGLQLLCLAVLVGGTLLSGWLIIGSDWTTWHDNAVTGIWMSYNAIMFLLYLAVPMGLYLRLRPDTDLAVFE